MELIRALLIVTLVGLFGLGACKVKTESEGEAPEVSVEGGRAPDVDVDAGEAPDVDVDPGRAPDVDVEGPDVDVGTDTTRVVTPDVDVDTPE